MMTLLPLGAPSSGDLPFHSVFITVKSTNNSITVRDVQLRNVHKTLITNWGRPTECMVILLPLGGAN